MKKEEPAIKFTVEKILTVDDMDDILTTALEGGIGYWARLMSDDPDWIKAEEQLKAKGVELYWSTVALQVLLNGDSIKMMDAEEAPDSPDLVIWTLDMKKFKHGCALFEQERGSITGMLEDGSFDAVEADCLIQYGVFGEVQFG